MGASSVPPPPSDTTERRRRRFSWRIVIAALVILGLIAAGVVVAVVLSSSGTSATSPEGGQGRSTVIDTPVSPGTARDNFEGARDNIDDFDCELQRGRWTVSGSVTNPLSQSVNYRIYTSFVDNSSRKTVGLLQVDVENVEGGATRAWSGSLDVSEPDLNCVLRVERITTGS